MELFLVSEGDYGVTIQQAAIVCEEDDLNEAINFLVYKHHVPQYQVTVNKLSAPVDPREYVPDLDTEPKHTAESINGAVDSILAEKKGINKWDKMKCKKCGSVKCSCKEK